MFFSPFFGCFIQWHYFHQIYIIAGMEPPASAQQALGQAIRVRRKELGYSQEGFAHICGLDRSHMGQIERGKSNITLGVLRQIASKLKLKPSEVLKRAGM